MLVCLMVVMANLHVMVINDFSSKVNIAKMRLYKLSVNIRVPWGLTSKLTKFNVIVINFRLVDVVDSDTKFL